MSDNEEYLPGQPPQQDPPDGLSGLRPDVVYAPPPAPGDEPAPAPAPQGDSSNNDARDLASAWAAGLNSALAGRLDAGSASAALLEALTAPADPPLEGAAAARAGFSYRGPADGMLPGRVLSGLLHEAGRGGYQDLTDDQLTGVLRAAARQISYQQAAQTRMVSELIRRRNAESRQPGRARLAEHIPDELSAELTLTTRSAVRLAEITAGLDRLPLVRALLAWGRIDWNRAVAMIGELSLLTDDDLARDIAGRYASKAAGWTTGQLRAALARAVLAADPAAAERRRKAARKDTRVDLWQEASGNAALAGRELKASSALALDRKLDAYAWSLADAGVPGSRGQLRALAFSTLLNGDTLESILDNPASWPLPDDEDAPAAPPPATPPPGDPAGGEDADGPGGGGSGDGSDSPAGSDTAADPPAGSAGTPGTGNGAAGSVPDADSSTSSSAPAGHDPAGHSAAGAAPAAPDPGATGAVEPARDRPGLALPPERAGSIHLILPLSSLEGGTEPGEVTGFGDVGAADGRDIAALLAADPATRWHVTVTATDGTAIAHACARHGPAPGQTASLWAAGLAGKLQVLEHGRCSHARQSAGYRPPASLRHLVTVRQRHCAAPGCRRAAASCDLDHTLAFDSGGLTCECNLAPTRFTEKRKCER